MNYDVFNGDADGICSLLQLRLDTEKYTNKEPVLVTGVKRDINLLEGLSKKIIPHEENQEEISLCVLDISLDRNRKPLVSLLDHGAKVLFIDHHFAGEIPKHRNLTTHINEAPNVCTSLLVNGLLKGKHPLWAITGAFGDNLKDSAISLAKNTSIKPKELALLEQLGNYVNYNGYGANLQDLHINPETLYKTLLAHMNPFEFISLATEFQLLKNGFEEDINKVQALEPTYQNKYTASFILPNEKWARRVSGVFGNALANQHVDRAHAVLTDKGDGDYLVSVRAPLNNKQGAADLCRQFASGGGRAAAAGINSLQKEQLEGFLKAFNTAYGS